MTSKKEKGNNDDRLDDGEIKIIGRWSRHVDKGFRGYVSSKKGTTKSRKASLHSFAYGLVCPFQSPALLLCDINHSIRFQLAYD